MCTMLGRKTFTQDELTAATTAMQQQLDAYRALPGSAALEAFEPLFFNNLALALDRRFVHRVRMATGKDPSPLNELELIVESLTNNDGVLRTGTVIRYVPEETVLGLQP